MSIYSKLKRIINPRIRYFEPDWNDLNHLDMPASNDNPEYIKKRISDILLSYFGFSDKARVMLFSSARSGMEFILKGLAKYRTDKNEVIIPSYACKALINAVKNANLCPVFVDIDESMMPDPTKVVSLINQKTLACLLHNLAGRDNYSDSVLNACIKNDVILLDDHCQSFFLNKHEHENVISFISFGFSKTISATAGGCVILPNNLLYLMEGYDSLPEDNALDAIERFKIYKKYYSSLFCKIKDRLLGGSNIKDISQTYYQQKKISTPDAKMILEIIIRADKIKSVVTKNYNDFFNIIKSKFGHQLFLHQGGTSCESLMLHFKTSDLKEKFESMLFSKNIELQTMYIPLHLSSDFPADNSVLKMTEKYYKCILNFPIRYTLSSKEKKRIMHILNRGDI